MRIRTLLLGACLASCGQPKPTSPADVGAAAPANGPDVARLFPLEDGHIFHYVTHDGADSGMLVAKVRRRDAVHGELQISSKVQRFEYRDDGVRFEGGPYILKAPLTPGNAWPGEHGGTTRIDGADVSVNVPAGTFSGCVRTVEAGGRVPGTEYATTYCPGVGIVVLAVTSRLGEGKAELRSFGPPVVIGGT